MNHGRAASECSFQSLAKIINWMPQVYTRQDLGQGICCMHELGAIFDVCDIRFPSPPSPAGLPLSWAKPVVNFPEDKLQELRGIDATIYVRFLRGCCKYVCPGRISIADNSCQSGIPSYTF